MTSITTQYRITHPEYRERERTKYREIENIRYATDEGFKQKKKERALAYYYKMKELKKTQLLKQIKFFFNIFKKKNDIRIFLKYIFK